MKVELKPINDPLFVSKTLPKRNLIILNTNVNKTNELAFILGHEIGHFVWFKAAPSMQNQRRHQENEKSADAYSLILIFSYYLRKNFKYEFCAYFAKFGIPTRMHKSAHELSRFTHRCPARHYCPL